MVIMELLFYIFIIFLAIGIPLLGIWLNSNQVKGAEKHEELFI